MATPLTIEQVPIDQLRPDPANPRRIGEDELGRATSPRTKCWRRNNFSMLSSRRTLLS
jgi:hypothetical protein